MINRRLNFHRFKLRQNAPLGNLLTLILPAVQSSKTSFQTAEECTITRLRIKKNLSSSNFRKHRINSVSMHQLASLLSKVSLRSPNFPKTLFQIA